MNQLALNLGILGLSFLLAGCGTFSPRADPSRFFTLSSALWGEEVPGRNDDNAEKISLGIGPVKFPGYLDRQEIVVRSGPNRFDVSENDRWAEPLDENFTRVLSENLSGLLQTDRIIVYPWSNERKPTYQVEIELLSFETNLAHDAQLSARWVVIDGNNKKPLDLQESRLTRPAKEKSTDGAVAALSEAVGDFSREIAKAVRAADGKTK
jgi:uncharacterized lipoprotein YmbA